ncbi:glycosyltransferase family 4 protein [Actinomadura alba]|uniref:Glycosyltransferase family 4 protein n=1 Tax=Actinomadura alba TaxID=406431 RepID=A0ABR7LKB1_9ACTN|nr:glycosyltransferase family 4 protein [Actinomadura alba]MBC6465248.1 glycosyltransferase family 4 protein [Actinomadura alba]
MTCSDALVAGLRAVRVGVDVVGSDAGPQTAWVGQVLERVERAVTSARYDAVLAFHAFWPFTADLRRVLDDSVPRPLVTYTHGSHWDESDLFRFERYPGLRWADLGNLLAADRVLVVSRYLRDVLVRNVHAVSAAAGAELDRRVRVVGLPLDLPRIDAARRPPEPDRPTTVFNHAPIAAKRPGAFLDVTAELLTRTTGRVVLTRHFPRGSPWAARVRELSDAFPGRVIQGDDLPTDEYYQALWRGHMQVSTAVHESLGVATLEAMVTGNHCLLPRIGAYPEVAAGDPAVLYDDLNDLLARLVAGPQAEVVARHDARIRARYAPETVAAAVRDVLAEVVKTVRG